MNDCSRKDLELAYNRLLNERNNILLALNRFQSSCHEGTASELQVLVNENNTLRAEIDFLKEKLYLKPLDPVTDL